MRWRVRPERKIESEVEREKKKIKCKSYSNRAYMHTFTPTDVSAFLFKMCKMRRFLHFVNFASADVGYIYIYIYICRFGLEGGIDKI